MLRKFQHNKKKNRTEQSGKTNKTRSEAKLQQIISSNWRILLRFRINFNPLYQIYWFDFSCGVVVFSNIFLFILWREQILCKIKCSPDENAHEVNHERNPNVHFKYPFDCCVIQPCANIMWPFGRWFAVVRIHLGLSSISFLSFVH